MTPGHPADTSIHSQIFAGHLHRAWHNVDHKTRPQPHEVEMLIGVSGRQMSTCMSAFMRPGIAK